MKSTTDQTEEATTATTTAFPIGSTLAGTISIAESAFPTTEEPAPADDWVPTRQPIPDPKRFSINSEARANWLLQRLANNAAEKARLIEQHAKMLAEIDTDSATLDFLFGTQLEAWTGDELLRRGGRRKTLNLPQGPCAFRTVPAEVVLLDGKEGDAELLAYAKEAGFMKQIPATEAREEFDKAAYLAAVTAQVEETGELPKWCDHRPARESFTYPGKPAPVKPKKGKATKAEEETPSP